MKTVRFLDWLMEDAPICISETNGNIIYTGRCGDAPLWTWSERELASIFLGNCGDTDEHTPKTDHDIVIIVSERKLKRKGERNG